ncbi:MAG TPA: sugar kinase [Armatimonadota bacterium]
MCASIVTFGEVMGRIAPRGELRFVQALPGAMEFTFGGGEANVAVSLALFGADATFVTALPKNPIADACVMTLRGLGVHTDKIVRTANGRLGLYYLETGANQRASNVVYDRDDSSLMLTQATAYDWASLFAGARWFHFTGITPALSANTAEATLLAAQAAKAAGLTVSCDLNFRKKLWTWQPGTKQRDLAEATMRKILPFVDVVIANEEDAEKVLGIHAAGADIEGGALNVEAYRDVAAQIVSQFPNVSKVAITLRESISATHNNWGGMLFDAATGQACFAPLDGAGNYTPYEIRDIVDRVGGGDSFGAGLIFALTTDGLNTPENAIRYAVAASCLKHSILGDFNYATRAEVEGLMAGQASGRVNR